MKTLAYLITINCLQFVQGENCNSELADKIISFENNYWPGYQLGLYHKKVRSGTKLLLNLVSVGYTQSPGTLWMSEKCRHQLCFSRYKYDQREMGDYYREIANEKNYFYMTRFGGLRVDHVWTSDLEEWKEKEPSDSANTFYGFDVFCDSCNVNKIEYTTQYSLVGCTVVTKKNNIEQWNSDKIGKMMATSSGWVQFKAQDKSEEWTIKIHDKNSIPISYLGPSSAFQINPSPILAVFIVFLINL